jgi:transketolase
MPSWDLFDSQPEEYRASVLPRTVKRRLAVEAASPFGWEHFVGEAGRVHGIRRFGASAPLKDVQKHFGFTPERIAAEAEEMLKG